MRVLKNIATGVTVSLILFASLEAVTRFFVFPGSYDFIERRIMEQKLAQHKDEGEIRIFLFGESTMFGGSLYPYSTIDKWLTLYIKDLLPEDVSARVKVLNFGRLGAGSEFITTSFMELIPYKPDLAVFYAVHNDYILTEHRRELLFRKPLGKRCEDFFETLPKKSSFLNLLNRWIIGAKAARNRVTDAKARRIDRWYDERTAGKALYEDPANLLEPGSAEIALVKKRFENNIDKTIRAAGKNSIPVIFLEGLSKWKDYEPVRSIHGRGIAPAGLAEWAKGFSRAEDVFKKGGYAEALTLYEACRAADPAYALTYYRLGQCHEALGDFKRANEFYSLANDNDHYPIRAPSSVNRFYEHIRASAPPGVYVIQTQKLFEERSPNGIVDKSLVIDQIHPNIEGQSIIALEIMKTIYGRGLLSEKARWRWGLLRRAEEMEKDLGLDAEARFDIALASAGYVEKHYARAAEFLEEAVRIKPGSVFGRSWLAWTYWKMGNPAKAADVYRQLYRDAPAMAAEFLDRRADLHGKLML